MANQRARYIRILAHHGIYPFSIDGDSLIFLLKRYKHNGSFLVIWKVVRFTEHLVLAYMTVAQLLFFFLWYERNGSFLVIWQVIWITEHLVFALMAVAHWHFLLDDVIDDSLVLVLIVSHKTALQWLLDRVLRAILDDSMFVDVWHVEHRVLACLRLLVLCKWYRSFYVTDSTAVGCVTVSIVSCNKLN